jgi:hypothetical protein
LAEVPARGPRPSRFMQMIRLVSMIFSSALLHADSQTRLAVMAPPGHAAARRSLVPSSCTCHCFRPPWPPQGRASIGVRSSCPIFLFAVIIAPQAWVSTKVIIITGVSLGCRTVERSHAHKSCNNAHMSLHDAHMSLHDAHMSSHDSHMSCHDVMTTRLTCHGITIRLHLLQARSSKSINQVNYHHFSPPLPTSFRYFSRFTD